MCIRRVKAVKAELQPSGVTSSVIADAFHAASPNCIQSIARSRNSGVSRSAVTCVMVAGGLHGEETGTYELSSEH